MLAKISNKDIYFSYFWKNGTRGILKKIEYILDIKTNIAFLSAMCISPRKKYGLACNVNSVTEIMK